MTAAPVSAAARALEVEGLEITVSGPRGTHAVVRDMSLAVAAGETVCLVGESGCGKSMTALSLMRLLPEAARIAGGRIRLAGADVLAMGPRDVEDLRGDRVAMIFQEPLTALNPVQTVGWQIAEAVGRHRSLSRRDVRQRVLEALRLARMPDPEERLGQYPHQLSGGMRQRAMIALALSCEPQVLIADEPTTALDVTMQAQILGLLADLQRRLGLAVLLITHDLGVVAEAADRVVVMYAGRRVEEADVTDLFDRPLHPYTLGLMGAVPGARSGRLVEIPGGVPPPWQMPPGCAFAPRCPRAVPRCRTEVPPLEPKAAGHLAACWEVPGGRD